MTDYNVEVPAAGTRIELDKDTNQYENSKITCNSGATFEKKELTIKGSLNLTCNSGSTLIIHSLSVDSLIIINNNHSTIQIDNLIACKNLNMQQIDNGSTLIINGKASTLISGWISGTSTVNISGLNLTDRGVKVDPASTYIH